MQVVKPVAEMVLPVSERDDDRHRLGWDAVGGCVAATQLHTWVLPLYPFQWHGGSELDQQAANCRGQHRASDLTEFQGHEPTHSSTSGYKDAPKIPMVMASFQARRIRSFALHVADPDSIPGTTMCDL